MTTNPYGLRGLSGAGNTFYVGLRKDVTVAESEWPLLVRRLCVDTVDGLLLLSEKKSETSQSEWLWHFFNADGSTAEMCGNAARCAAHFLSDQTKLKEFVFWTGAGRVLVRVDSGIYFVEMTPARILQERVLLALGETVYAGTWLDTGVPHFVMESQSLDAVSKEECAQLRRHSHFGSSGANITLMIRKGQGQLEAKTFERGVENFTQACGTGAVAAARVASEGRSEIIHVAMPGGELVVDLTQERPILMGDARYL